MYYIEGQIEGKIVFVLFLFIWLCDMLTVRWPTMTIFRLFVKLPSDKAK